MTSLPPATVTVTGNSAISPTVMATPVASALAKPGCVHGDGISAGSQLAHTVAALAVAAAGAFQTLGDIPHGDGGVGHAAALRIFHADVEVAGGGALGKCKLTDEQEHDREKEQTQ